jgi:hypothetical protein
MTISCKLLQTHIGLRACKEICMFTELLPLTNFKQ